MGTHCPVCVPKGPHYIMGTHCRRRSGRASRWARLRLRWAARARGQPQAQAEWVTPGGRR
eukprot:3754221-Rhodomonas_salina.3